MDFIESKIRRLGCMINLVEWSKQRTKEVIKRKENPNFLKEEGRYQPVES